MIPGAAQIAAACLLFVMLGRPAIAETPDSTAPRCASDPGIPFDQTTIAACTAVLQNGASRSRAELLNAYYVRGMTYGAWRDTAHALADFDAALRIDPDFPEALRGRGVVEMNEKQYDLAIADFTAALRLRPDYGDALYARSMAHFSRGDTAAAQADLDAAQRISPRSPGGSFTLGMALQNHGDYAHAIAAFDRVIEAKVPIYYNLALTFRGRAFVAQGDDARAMADFETCVREFPKFADCYDQRGLLLEKRGDADFDLAVKYNPDTSSYLAHRAALEEKLGKHAAAAKDLARVKELPDTQAK
jgi:tetratricopeptide (TPR) repeat protein